MAEEEDKERRGWTEELRGKNGRYRMYSIGRRGQEEEMKRNLDRGNN